MMPSLPPRTPAAMDEPTKLARRLCMAIAAGNYSDARRLAGEGARADLLVPCRASDSACVTFPRIGGPDTVSALGLALRDVGGWDLFLELLGHDLDSIPAAGSFFRRQLGATGAASILTMHLDVTPHYDPRELGQLVHTRLAPGAAEPFFLMGDEVIAIFGLSDQEPTKSQPTFDKSRPADPVARQIHSAMTNPRWLRAARLLAVGARFRDAPGQPAGRLWQRLLVEPQSLPRPPLPGLPGPAPLPFDLVSQPASVCLGALAALLAHGLDVNARWQGRTLLHQAAPTSLADAPAIVHWLLEHGADPRALLETASGAPALQPRDAAALAQEAGRGDVALTIAAWRARRALVASVGAAPPL